jgi:N-acetylglucosamine malate deacetylase 1
MPFQAPPLPAVLARPPRGRVLVVAPHPDDEIIGPGGTLLHHADQGDAIRIVFVCSGVHGDPNGYFERSGYVGLRQSESRAVAERFLGTTDLHFFGYPDGLDDEGLARTFPSMPSDPEIRRRVLIDGLSSRLVEHVREHDPRIVYYPWAGEMHADHWACGAAVENLRAGMPEVAAGRSFLGYEVWSTLVPETLVDISATQARKSEATRGFVSQMRYFDYATIVAGLNAHRGLLMQRLEHGYAEAFIGRFDAVRAAEPAP